MILVDGLPVDSSDVTTPPRHGRGGFGMLLLLLKHSSLLDASNLLTSAPVRIAKKVIGDQNHVYVFQGEHATVDPQLVQFVGTDESTTCVGIAIRNPESGMTSVAHLDSPSVVDSGLTDMLSGLACETSIPLDVHLIGAFKDMDYEGNVGYSSPLCSKIIEALQNSLQKFELRTLCVLGHNTRRNHDGHNCPIITGFLVETLSGSVMPACFDQSVRCPDELVRRLRVMVSSQDRTWQGRLLKTYDTALDRFYIAACSWMSRMAYHAKLELKLSDADLLRNSSTSPFAEAPDFAENHRRVLTYLINHRDWKQTFPDRRPRIFRRTAGGGWSECDHE